MLSALDALDHLLAPSLASPRPRVLVAPPPCLPASAVQMIDSCVLSHPSAALIRRAAFLQDVTAADGSATAALLSIRIYTAVMQYIHHHHHHHHNPSIAPRIAQSLLNIDAQLHSLSSLSQNNNNIDNNNNNNDNKIFHFSSDIIVNPVAAVAYSAASTSLPRAVAYRVSRAAAAAAARGRHVHITAWLDSTVSADVHRGRVCLAVPRRRCNGEHQYQYRYRCGRILVIAEDDCDLAANSTSKDGEVTMTTMKSSTTGTPQGRHPMIDGIIKDVLDTPGLVAVIYGGRADEHAAGMLTAAGIVFVDEVAEASLRMICRITHARALHSLRRQKKGEGMVASCGVAERVDVRVTASQMHVFIAGDPSTGDIGVLLRAPTDTTLQLMEHNIRRIMRTIKHVDNGIVPGEGRTEVCLADMMQCVDDGWNGEISNLLSDVLNGLARTILFNRGNTASQINKQLSNWRNTGVSIDSVSVWDTAISKFSALHIALDTAAILLRIDTIIRPKAPPSTNSFQQISSTNNKPTSSSDNWIYRRGQRRLRAGGSGWSEEEKKRWEKKEERFYRNRRQENQH